MCVAGIAALLAACGADEPADDIPPVAEDETVLEVPDDEAAATDVMVNSWIIEPVEDLPLSAVTGFGGRASLDGASVDARGLHHVEIEGRAGIARGVLVEGGQAARALGLAGVQRHGAR
jgi:hypothetical protein